MRLLVEGLAKEFDLVTEKHAEYDFGDAAQYYSSMRRYYRA
jgi:hypothetical protein